jgi:hypothetical protein
MAKYLVFNKPAEKVTVPGLKFLTEPDLDFKIEFELPSEIEKTASKDPLLQQEFQVEAKKIYKYAKVEVAKKLVAFDKYFEGMINNGAKLKAVQKQVDTVNATIRNDIAMYKQMAEMAVEKAWSDLKAKRKEWTKFKIKIFVNIGLTIAGLAVSIAAMATSPFSGGAGAAFGIIGFFKSGVKLATEIGKLAISIDDCRKLLEKELAIVEKAASNKALNAANEISAAVFNEFLGISQPSVKTCIREADTLKAKFAQMVVNVHDLAKDLNKVLVNQEKMKKEFMAEVKKRVEAHPVTNKTKWINLISDQYDKYIDNLSTKVMDLIGDVQSMYANMKSWVPKVKELVDRVGQLEIKDPKYLKVFREVLKFAALATSIFDGNEIAAKAKDIGMGIGAASVGYAFDKITSKAIDGTIFDAA